VTLVLLDLMVQMVLMASWSNWNTKEIKVKLVLLELGKWN
jgi:hypothetical protein